jgi:hypothetical protein
VGFGAGTTPLVREYRQTVSGLVKTGFYSAEQKVLSQYGYGQYKSIGDLTKAAVDSYMKTYQQQMPQGMTTAQLRTLITNKVAATRTIRLLGLGVEKQRIIDLQGQPQLLQEAIKFGLAQSTKYIEDAILQAQQQP